MHYGIHEHNARNVWRFGHSFNASHGFPRPTFFRAPEKKDFPFFSCGATPSRAVPKTQPLQVAFSLRERVDLRCQKEGILGKKIARGRGGADKEKKKEKRMHKKRWVEDFAIHECNV